MGYKHLDNVNMNANHTSDVIQFVDESGEAGTKKGFVIVSWENVTGSLDGTIALQIVEPANVAGTTNHAPVTVSTQNITATPGAYRWDFTAPVENVKLVYTKNNITGGTLKITMYTIPVGR